ncbi:MAG: flagellin lysine-N-methylase [Oscillospiraceae bacterium]|nr:flagellin lysine-N-methylase [Oscillospiraceae bacterium]
MKLVAPDYYKKFKCIADKCKHSCCIGWEIDVDDDTLAYYNSISGEFGERLRSSIDTDGETAHFCLEENDRCPFLNEKGLCDIITELGEQALCQICDDHPRYRNFYSDSEEIGVGMSCEAAAMLILSHQDKTQLETLCDADEILWEEETEFIKIRGKLWNMLQNREKTVDSRIKDALGYCGIAENTASLRQWVSVYRGLERLDSVWDTVLDALENADENNLVLPQFQWLEIAFEQLIVYFTYRHLADSLDDGRFVARMQFAVQSYRMIKYIAALHFAHNGSIDIGILAEIARIYSAEIEYSTDNIEALLDIFEK